MAKVGRASRNSSLTRIETVTASKTLTLAESGEVYLIDASGGGVTITLPPVSKAGQYFKFVFVDEMDGGNFKIQGNATTEYIVGGAPVRALDDGHDGTVSVSAKGTTTDIFTIVDGPGIHEGTWIEVISDGTTWFLTGNVIGGNQNTTAISA